MIVTLRLKGLKRHPKVVFMVVVYPDWIEI